MYFNLVDSGYDLDMREQDLQSFDRKVGYTDGFDFPCFEQFLHILVRIDECWWFLWVEHVRKGCISDCVWLVYETKAKWDHVTSVIGKTDLRQTLEASALDTDRYNRSLTLRATARKLHERGDGPYSWKILRLTLINRSKGKRDIRKFGGNIQIFPRDPRSSDGLTNLFLVSCNMHWFWMRS